MSGAVDAQGHRRLRQGLVNFVLMKNAGQWRIVVTHNMDLFHPGNELATGLT